MTTMNLTTDPWIPAVRLDGGRELLSLQSLFARAHELRDLAARPHERVALTRLLLCVAQAALDGPADEEDWEQCEARIQPSAETYLAKWKDAFELFGEGPRFLQLPNLASGKEADEGTPATKLDLALASGNNSALFDNAAGSERAQSDARCALNLLAFQCFSPCGRVGVAKWNGKDTPGKGSSNHAPCVPSSMVHALVLGETLLATLHANLLTKEDVVDLHGPDRWGAPVWELPVRAMDDAASIANATLTHLGRLAPLSRAIRLLDGGQGVILGNGLDYPIFPAFREASATVITRDEELALLPASTSRSFWRQLAAVSAQAKSGGGRVGGPRALARAKTNAETILWLGALVTGKAKIEDLVDSSYSLPPAMFSDWGRAAYERGVGHAEELERALLKSVKSYASSLKVVDAPYDRARQHFWTRVEQELSELFAFAQNPATDDEIPGTPWGRAVQAAAREAYERSCPRQTPRQIQAYALGLRTLAFRSKPKTQDNPKQS